MSDSASKAPNSTSSRRSNRTASVPATGAGAAPASNSGATKEPTTEDILEVEGEVDSPTSAEKATATPSAAPTAAATALAAMTSAAAGTTAADDDGMQVDEPAPAQAQSQQAEEITDVDAAEGSKSASGSVNGKGDAEGTTNGNGAASNGDADAATTAGADDDDEDEEGSDIAEGEYEIEAILDNKKLTGKGKSGHEYLVSWVGYGPEFNEWVSEDNFGSHEMIDTYWAKMGGKPQKAQSKRADTSSGSKRRRADDSPSANAGPSKRGRRALSPITDPVSDAEAEEASIYARSHKDSMKEYADHKSWEDDVKSVETIERGANEKLIVYMIMKNGEKTAQDAETCNIRCPQKMLKFYEGHLKWRQTK